MQDWQALRAKGDVETAVLLRAGQQRPSTPASGGQIAQSRQAAQIAECNQATSRAGRPGDYNCACKYMDMFVWFGCGV